MIYKRIEKEIVYLYRRAADIDDEILDLLKKASKAELELNNLQQQKFSQDPQFKIAWVISHLRISILKASLSQKNILPNKRFKKIDRD